MFNIGTQELLIILLVVLVLFGAKRIPEVARALGKGVGDFRDALSGMERELKGETPVRKGEPGPRSPNLPAQPHPVAGGMPPATLGPGERAPRGVGPGPVASEPDSRVEVETKVGTTSEEGAGTGDAALGPETGRSGSEARSQPGGQSSSQPGSGSRPDPAKLGPSPPPEESDRFAG